MSLQTTAIRLAGTAQTWYFFPDTENEARSPTVDKRVQRTISDDNDEAERRQPRALRSEDGMNSSLANYGGAVACKHMNVGTTSLYCTNVVHLAGLLKMHHFRSETLL